MRFDVLTLFPELIQNACSYSIIKRAIESNLVEINTINPRDYSKSKHKKVDDTPFGGGAGMVLACQPYLDALSSIKKEENNEIILLTPQGKPYTQEIAKEFSKKKQIILICGHYEGFDERIRVLSGATEISIGDFVMTGGEYPSLCIIDSITRLIDKVLGDNESFEYDSHSDGLLEYPHYTKPREYNCLEVPEVLLSGNHAEIEKWRYNQQLERTKTKRPDLYEKFFENNK